MSEFEVTQKNRVKLAQFLDIFFVEDLSRGQVAIAPKIQRLGDAFEVFELGHGLENLLRLTNDFRASAISGNDCDF